MRTLNERAPSLNFTRKDRGVTLHRFISHMRTLGTYSWSTNISRPVVHHDVASVTYESHELLRDQRLARNE